MSNFSIKEPTIWQPPVSTRRLFFLWIWLEKVLYLPYQLAILLCGDRVLYLRLVDWWFWDGLHGWTNHRASRVWYRWKRVRLQVQKTPSKLFGVRDSIW